MTPTQIRNIVAFSLLMEQHGGIHGKAPSYIEEKFQRYCTTKARAWPWGLDSNNVAKFEAWQGVWDKEALVAADE